MNWNKKKERGGERKEELKTLPLPRAPSLAMPVPSSFYLNRPESTTPPLTTIFFFFAATQLARQVHEERTQVVCSNKVDIAPGSKALPQFMSLYVSWYVRVVDTHSI